MSRLCSVLLLLCLVAEAASFSCGTGLRSTTPRLLVSRAAAAEPHITMMGLVRQVTTAEFEVEIQDSSTPILVDFMAPWCTPCKQMEPQLEDVAERFQGAIRVLKVDSDEEPDVSSALQIVGLPTILLINEMSVIMRAEGALVADEIEQLVARSAYLDGLGKLRKGLEAAVASSPKLDEQTRGAFEAQVANLRALRQAHEQAALKERDQASAAVPELEEDLPPVPELEEEIREAQLRLTELGR